MSVILQSLFHRPNSGKTPKPLKKTDKVSIARHTGNLVRLSNFTPVSPVDFLSPACSFLIQTKLTPAERLKKKMQQQLSRTCLCCFCTALAVHKWCKLCWDPCDVTWPLQISRRRGLRRRRQKQEKQRNWSAHYYSMSTLSWYVKNT